MGKAAVNVSPGGQGKNSTYTLKTVRKKKTNISICSRHRPISMLSESLSLDFLFAEILRINLPIYLRLLKQLNRERKDVWKHFVLLKKGNNGTLKRYCRV